MEILSLTKDCNKAPEAKSQCTNCYKDHPANSRDCEVDKRQIQKKKNQRRKPRILHQRKHPEVDLENQLFSPLPTTRMALNTNPELTNTAAAEMQHDTRETLKKATLEPLRRIQQHPTQVDASADNTTRHTHVSGKNCINELTMAQIVHNRPRDKIHLAKENETFSNIVNEI